MSDVPAIEHCVPWTMLPFGEGSLTDVSLLFGTDFPYDGQDRLGKTVEAKLGVYYT